MPRSVRRGRPPLDPDDRSVSLTLRLPSKAYDALCRRAIETRQSVAETARALLLARARVPGDDDGR